VASASAKLTAIFAGNYNMLVIQGADTASLTFVNSAGNSTIATGAAGGILAFDGAGGTINLTDSTSGSTAGSSTVGGIAGPFIPAGGTGTGTSSGTVSTAFNYLVGATGAETLNASGSGETAVLVAGQANAYAVLGTGADAFFAGSGASTVVGGTSSGSALPDLYAFVNGASGGSDLIQNWGAASGLVFLNYGAAGDAAIKAAIAATPTNTPSVSLVLPDNTQITITGINGAAVNLNNNPIYLS
jgi:hypothetical protein